MGGRCELRCERQTMYTLYTILLFLAGCGLMPRLLWRCLHGAAYHRDWRERFGYSAATCTAAYGPAGCVWFHAASVGEVQGVQPIVAALHERFPGLPVVVSTFTPAGKILARRLVPEAVAVFLLPFDFPWIMRRMVRRLRPRAVIVQETELWPHLFRAAVRQRVPVVLVNGRLSPRAFRRYGWVRPLMRRVLADVTLLLAQSPQSARRFQSLGASTQCLHMTGSTNIDRALLIAEQPIRPHPLASLVQGKRLLVGGSTHAGEDTVLLDVYHRLRGQYPDLMLILAPRHLERVETVVRQVQASHCRALRRSQCDTVVAADLVGPTVLILDTLGELPRLYKLCTVAFVGGSLVPAGGHNILEPAMFAKPLFFGPYMQGHAELAAMLCHAGGAGQVLDGAELGVQVAHILAYPDEGHAMGQRAFCALVANRGALERTTRLVTELLHQTGVDLQLPPPAGKGEQAP
jgi:3-deoxy-D-manno-octulosonic-acid transferase